MVVAMEVQIANANAITAVTPQNLDDANKTLISLHNSGKALSNHVESLKKPLNQVLKAVRDCAERAETPLIEAKKLLQNKIAAYQAAEARRQAEVREAAEAERRRLQAIADAEHAAKVAAAKKQAEEDAKLVAELMGAPVEVKPVVVAPPPTIAVAVPVAAEPVKQTVVMRTVKKLVITDPSLIPITVGGVEVRPVDEVKLKSVLMSGVTIPGASIVEEQVAAMGRT